MRPVIREEAIYARIREAISFAGESRPVMRKVIERRLKHIVPLGGERFEGTIVIHNYEGESVIGEYNIHEDSIKSLSVEDLAERISIVALLIEMEQDARPIGTWTLSGREVDSLIGKSEIYLAAVGD